VGSAIIGQSSQHRWKSRPALTYTGSSGPRDLDFSLDAQGFALNPDVGLQTAEVIQD
jgi:hypothetical protein